MSSDFDLSIALAELSTEMKYMVKKLDSIEQRLVKYDHAHDKVIMLESKVKNSEKELHDFKKLMERKSSYIGGGVGAAVIALWELIRFFFL